MSKSLTVRVQDAIVTATFVDGVEQTTFPVRAKVESITYAYATADGGVSSVDTGVTPKRRLAANVEVVAAEPYDPCKVVLVVNERFLHVNETIVFEEGCG